MMADGKFVGIQLGSHSILDEGAEHCLDLLQETAGVNAVFVYQNHYFNFVQRAVECLAPDHGVEVTPDLTRNQTMLWSDPDDKYFAGTILRHQRSPEKETYADRDIFNEVIPPAHKRGIKVYARILEPFNRVTAQYLDNYLKVLSVNYKGMLYENPCWNNENYRNWWLATVEDMFKRYPLDGFKYGSERPGPISQLLAGKEAGCFCRYCRERGARQGIQAEKAKEGFRVLGEWIRDLKRGSADTSEGILMSTFRIFLEHPAMIQWDQLMHESREEMTAMMAGAMKVLSPNAEFGVHIHQSLNTWDLAYRARLHYADMAQYADFIKPSVYFDIAGPRMKEFIENKAETTLKELAPGLILELYYAVMGYSAGAEPGWEQLSDTGFTENYSFRETKRCVDAVKGRAKVYTGVGFDVPWKNAYYPTSKPEAVYAHVGKALEAGAAGVLLSREYDEMRLDNLKAVGRAVRDFS